MNLTRINWPLGWTPSADPTNGNPDGLLRMDNLQQDEYGVLSLVRGLKQINVSPFSNYVDQLYSKLVNGKEILWAALGQTGNSVVRSQIGDFSDAFEVCEGTNRVTFSDALGSVLVLAGQVRKKDKLTKVQDLGLKTPKKCTITKVSQSKQIINGTWFINEGAASVVIGTTGEGSTVDADTLRGIIGCEVSGIDTTNIVDGPSTDPANDIIQFSFIPDDSSTITSVRLDVVLDSSYSGTLTLVSNYYSFSWTQDQLLPGQLIQTVLSAKRGDFTRNGSDATLDWRTVQAFLWTIEATAQDAYIVQDLAFLGGLSGGLNGTYTWIQVNVNNDNFYLAKSPAGPASDQKSVINGFVTLRPSAVESQVNEIWFYRRTAASVGIGSTSTLDQYYLVAKTTPGVDVDDKASDSDALLQNEKLNPFLISLQPLTDGFGLVDDIFSIEGLYNERMLYMTINAVWLSDRLNPDAVDSRYTIRASGDPTEKNLWIRKLTNNVVILGTTKNLYELTGTFLDLPDGTIDIAINAIGESYPPLVNEVCNIPGGGIAYFASDGIRLTAGSNSTMISPQLKLLFQGETRSEVPPVVISEYARYSMAIGKTRLYCTFPEQDGSRRLLIYNFLDKTWRIQYTDPTTVYGTKSDRVLLGYNQSTKSFLQGGLFELDVNQGVTDSSGNVIEGIPMTFQTVYDANQQPRNRKDSFTLKLICDTGNRPVSVYIGLDGKNFISLGTATTNGQTTVYFDLSAINVTLGFRYAIKIVDVNLLFSFKLYEMTIEYDPRPEQLNYLRIPPTNLDSYSRKRITAIAFVIDTLGNNIIFKPLLDNSNTGILPLTSTVNTSTKQTYVHYFTQEQIATDISGLLSGGVFEFYGINLQETVSEKLPIPTEFLIIPSNNYGSPDRKRHSSYKFQINTRGKNVSFTPILDGVPFASQTFNTTRKQTVEYFFDITLGDIIGIDIGGTLSSLEATPFEFYDVIVPQQIETLPPRLKYFRIPNSNLGSVSRKRIVNYAFVIDTYGFPVTFTPLLDNSNIGVLPANTTVLTTGKQTVIHYFNQEQICTDLGGYLVGSQPFECYGVDIEKIVSEEMPTPVEYLVIPPNNYGTPNRKRHTSYKFQINTRGGQVKFTPILDGQVMESRLYTNNVKTTIEYFFDLNRGDVIGIDIGGILESTQTLPFEFYGVIVPQDVETLPPRLESFRIPNNNLGTDSRKRFINYAFVIDTYGHDVLFTPFIDNTNSGIVPTTSIINTSGKQTYIHFFRQEQIGTDIGGFLSSPSLQPFEFYGLNSERISSEVLPTPTEYLLIPANNYGTPNRKRHTSYKFQINTRGANVKFTPILDNQRMESQVYNTSVKQTVEYFFNLQRGDVIGIDIGGILESLDSVPFEFYDIVIPQEVETLPPRLEYYRIPNSNLGTVSRKRFVNYAIVIDTYGFDVTLTPLIDNINTGVQPSSTIVNTTGKQTVIHYFTKEQLGTDIGAFLQGNHPFECYGINPERIVSEILPTPVKYLVIPANNYGTPNRKRHSSYKFQIDTRGKNVRFTPYIDTTAHTPTIYNTPKKTTVEYFFPTADDDIIGIDVYGILESLEDTPFEFYDVIIPQQVETLPPRLEFFRIPNTNMGVAARKRLRTIPIIIDTYGTNVSFTPIIDGVEMQPPTILNCKGKTTLYHYFNTDIFCTDIGGKLVSSSGPFEFYELGQIENVETLPVPKQLDQVGPVRFDKIGKIFNIRVRMITNGTTTIMPYTIYGDTSSTNPSYNQALFSGTFAVNPGTDDVYEFQVPKNINSTIFRISFGPFNDTFHRYDVQIKVSTSGMESNSQWIPAR